MKTDKILSYRLMGDVKIYLTGISSNEDFQEWGRVRNSN
jgi:hypothetical protein